MASGQTGHHGNLVVTPVEKEIKLKEEIVQIPRQLMVAATAVTQTQTLNPDLAI